MKKEQIIASITINVFYKIFYMLKSEVGVSTAGIYVALHWRVKVEVSIRVRIINELLLYS